ncbi:MAG: hypothetical protein OQK24_00085 [Magnetovibrio sp.]|nr:hypothetical protein [Magnetovibrio sp.]
MIKRIPKQELIRAAFHGMAMAEKKFSKMTSNTLHFCQAPEYLLTVNVAETLNKSAPNHLTWLEFQLSQARSAARGHQPALEQHMSRGRCDILMCWASSKEPRAAFEIKRDVQTLSTVKTDVERILYLLNGGVDGNTLQFGAVMFSTMAESIHGRQVIKNRVEQFQKKLDGWRTTMGAHNRRLNIVCGDIKKRRAGDYWAPMAVIAERERKNGPNHDWSASTMSFG